MLNCKDELMNYFQHNNCQNIYTMSTKNLTVCFLAISQFLLGQIQKVRSVLKSACSEDFKTVPTFDIWPSRS